MSEQGRGQGRSTSAGRRQGRNTTFATRAYEEGDASGAHRPRDLMEPGGTGGALVDPNIDGFRAPTALFDKGQFLGELAELDGAPDTRAQVEAEPSPPRGCRLIIVAGPDLGMEWAFKVPEVVIGRDEDCELPLSDIAVSRRHARLELEGNGFVLVDLSSGNGTFLNGVRVAREPLSPGDEITVGERTFRFVELNEAPPTAAAHPVPRSLGHEPSVGVVPSVEDEDGFEPLGRASQVDVKAAPELEPQLGSAKAPVVPAPKKQGQPQAGRALRSTAIVVGVLVLVLALVAGGVVWHLQGKGREAEAQRLILARIHFLQGIELVKQRRFGDAVTLFDRVLLARPGYDRALEYKAHAEKELEAWRVLEASRAAAAAGRFVEAIETLKGVPAESAYTQDAADLIRGHHRAIAMGLVAEARGKLASGDLDGALELVRLALERSPELQAAKSLEIEIQNAKDERSKPVVRVKPRQEIPPILMRAAALYKNGQVAAAIDAAEAAGGSEAKEWAARMERVKILLAEAQSAHKKKAAGELLRIAPAALEIDQQIAGGEGRVKERLDGYYADGLYLKGIEAYQEKDDVRAFKLLSQALAVQPGHKLAETRLAEITGKARDIYYEGYSLKDTNAAETRRIFKRLTQMTRPDNPYHKLAAKWLASNGG